MSSTIPSRTRFHSCYGLWLSLATVAACIDAQEEKKASQPPPIVGSGRGSSGTQAQPPASASVTRDGTAGASTQVGSASAADGGERPTLDAAEADLDAGQLSPGSGAAGSGAALAGRGGSSGAFAAGSSAGGRGGAGGLGGAAGALPTGAACMDQLCFTLVDCWLLSPQDCNYVACENFVCR